MKEPRRPCIPDPAHTAPHCWCGEPPDGGCVRDKCGVVVCRHHTICLGHAYDLTAGMSPRLGAYMEALVVARTVGLEDPAGFHGANRVLEPLWARLSLDEQEWVRVYGHQPMTQTTEVCGDMVVAPGVYLEDLWCLDTTIARWLVPRLRAFKEHGADRWTPLTEEETAEALDAMIAGFEAAAAGDVSSLLHHKEKIDRAVDLLTKHFTHLWW